MARGWAILTAAGSRRRAVVASRWAPSKVLVVVLVAASVLALAAAAPPAGAVAFDGPHDPASPTIVQQVDNDGRVLTMRLTRQNLRGPSFEVRRQTKTGTYVVVDPGPERSYLGTVDEDPGAIAAGVIRADGKLHAVIVFDRGATWHTLGPLVTAERSVTNPLFGYPTTPSLRAGSIGPDTYEFDLAIDSSSAWFNQAGATSAAALEHIEFSVNAIRAIYQRDALLRPRLARVVLRSSADRDPYANASTVSSVLAAARTEWSTGGQASAPRDNLQVVTTLFGGVAYLSSIANQFAISVVSSESSGDFDIIGRHELAHNWGPLDFHSTQSEDRTIMEGNVLGRFGGGELESIIDGRDDNLSVLDRAGVVSGVDLPPYATIDAVEVVERSGTYVIPVTANDHDANGDALTLESVDPTSAEGGTATKVGDTVHYTPPADLARGDVDVIRYRIADDTGLVATGVVVAMVRREHTTVPAETGTAMGSTVIADEPGRLYLGDGYAQLGQENDALEVVVPSPAARTADLVVRYARPEDGPALSLTVNGKPHGSLSLPSTGGTNVWKDRAPVAVPLVAGDNHLRLTMADLGTVRLDQVRVEWDDGTASPLTVDDTVAVEGSQADVAVHLGETRTGPVSVTMALVDSDGGRVGDPVRVTVPPGVRESTVHVPMPDDHRPEGDELLGIDVLTTSPNASSGPGATVRLVDDDADGTFVPIPPSRVIDTRDGGPRSVASGATLVVPVAGRGGVPPAGASAVALNVTIVSPERSTFLSVTPGGGSSTSNLNASSGQVVANHVVAPLGPDGSLRIFNFDGATDVVVDVMGYYVNASQATASQFLALAPSRLADTRTGEGGRLGALGTGEAAAYLVRGPLGVPGVPADAVAAVVNLTITEPSLSTYLTATPDGALGTSNLNVDAGETRANLVTVPIGPDGRIVVRNYRGSAHVVLDLLAVYVPAGRDDAGALVGLNPRRVADTRLGLGATGPLGPGGGAWIDLAPLLGELGIAPARVDAVVLNVTATEGTAPSFFSVTPTGGRTTSNLNFRAGDSVPNQVVVPLDGQSRFRIENHAGSAHAVVDVFGVFVKPPPG